MLDTKSYCIIYVYKVMKKNNMLIHFGKLFCVPCLFP